MTSPVRGKANAVPQSPCGKPAGELHVVLQFVHTLGLWSLLSIPGDGTAVVDRWLKWLRQVTRQVYNDHSYRKKKARR